MEDDASLWCNWMQESYTKGTDFWMTKVDINTTFLEDIDQIDGGRK